MKIQFECNSAATQTFQDMIVEVYRGLRKDPNITVETIEAHPARARLEMTVKVGSKKMDLRINTSASLRRGSRIADVTGTTVKRQAKGLFRASGDSNKIAYSDAKEFLKGLKAFLKEQQA